jgi:hypothetical protein
MPMEEHAAEANTAQKAHGEAVVDHARKTHTIEMQTETAGEIKHQPLLPIYHHRHQDMQPTVWIATMRIHQSTSAKQEHAQTAMDMARAQEHKHAWAHHGEAAMHRRPQQKPVTEWTTTALEE